MRNILVFLSVLLICSCKKEKKVKTRKFLPQIESRDEEVVKDKFLEFKKDTFYSKGNQILFLRPNEEFFESKLKNEEGIYEVDGDFGYYTNKVSDSLKNKYDIKFITERVLSIINNNDTIFIDRYKDYIFYTTILNSKKEKYITLKGVYTDIGLIQEINKFYKNK